MIRAAMNSCNVWSGVIGKKFSRILVVKGQISQISASRRYIIHVIICKLFKVVFVRIHRRVKLKQLRDETFSDRDLEMVGMFTQAAYCVVGPWSSSMRSVLIWKVYTIQSCSILAVNICSGYFWQSISAECHLFAEID